MMNLFSKKLQPAIGGFVLLFLGTYFWLKNYFPDWDLWAFVNVEQNWPIVLILVGSYLLLSYYNR